MLIPLNHSAPGKCLCGNLKGHKIYAVDHMIMLTVAWMRSAPTHSAALALKDSLGHM